MDQSPDDLSLLSIIASFYLRHNHRAEAAAVYERAIERSPANDQLKARQDQLQPGVVAVWNFDDGPEGWGQPHACNVTESGGALHIEATEIDPWVIVKVDAAPGWKELTLHVRARQDCPAQLFWATEATSDFAQERSTLFTVHSGNGQWSEAKIRFQADAPLTALRLDPAPEGPMYWEIDAATLAEVEPSPE